MTSLPLACLALALVATACGGSTRPPEGAPVPSHEDEEAKMHHDDHAEASPAVHDFHEVLAPLWHSDKGPERVAKTCAQAATLKEKATATKDAELVAATDALAAECAKDGRPEFEARFAAVHESFHGVAKRSKH
jgi:hypothetical protein